MFWSFLHSKVVFGFLTMWLYKFLINALEDKWCIGPGCTTCGALVFRASLISNLNCFKENIDPSELSINDQNNLNGPVYYKLSDDIKRKIVDEMSDQLKKLTHSQIKHLGEPGNGILTSLFCEFSDKSDYLHSLLVGSPSGAFLKKMIDHNNSRR